MFRIFDQLEQVSPRTKLCNDVNVSSSLNTVFELYQKRVRQNLHDAALMTSLKNIYAIIFRADKSSYLNSITFMAT